MALTKLFLFVIFSCLFGYGNRNAEMIKKVDIFKEILS